MHHGGELGQNSLTESLFDMIGTYVREDVDMSPFVNHTAWPRCEEVDADWFAAHRSRIHVVPYGALDSVHWPTGALEKQSIIDYQDKMLPGYVDALALFERDYQQLAPDMIKVDYDAIVGEFSKHGISGTAARNGLSQKENRFLLTTAAVDAGLYLIMNGLTSIYTTQSGSI